MNRTTLKSIVLLFVVALFSCNVPTYHQTQIKCYNLILNKNYQEALAQLEKNNYVKHKHSTILYLLEKGRIQFLNKEYENSFKTLEEADRQMIIWADLKERDIAGYVQTISKNETKFGTFTSSSKSLAFKDLFKSVRKTDYRPAPYERILIHYYKALALIFLSRTDDALVEARQVEELSNGLDDLKNAEPFAKNYCSDAMPQLLSGLLYEIRGDLNSAFISYENAYKKLMSADAGLLYGCPVPQQLQDDLLRLSVQLQFHDKTQYYEIQFGRKAVMDSATRYIFILIDNGLIPFKEESRKWYHQKYGIISEGLDKSKNSLLFSRPEFVSSPARIDEIIALDNRVPQLLYNPFHITTQVMNRRYTWQTDRYLENCFRGDSVINTIPQHRRSDTRNWQTLPHTIQLVKIPAPSGKLSLPVKHKSGTCDTLWIEDSRKNHLIYLANYSN